MSLELVQRPKEEQELNHMIQFFENLHEFKVQRIVSTGELFFKGKMTKVFLTDADFKRLNKFGKIRLMYYADRVGKFHISLELKSKYARHLKYSYEGENKTK
jgi:hypothetical protein